MLIFGWYNLLFGNTNYCFTIPALFVGATPQKGPSFCSDINLFCYSIGLIFSCLLHVPTKLTKRIAELKDKKHLPLRKHGRVDHIRRNLS